MANPYVDTTLIECNRLQSTQQGQVDTNESNAIFTNKTGSTVILEQGDMISVQSAFINQKGCNIPTSLEFKGKYLTNVILDKTNGLIVKNDNVDFMGKVSHVNLPEINDKVTTPVFDNKATLEVNYYKTSNGEMYAFLPRKFMSPLQPTIGSGSATAYQDIWRTADINLDDVPGSTAGVESGTSAYPMLYVDCKTFTNFNDYHNVYDVRTSPAGSISYLRPKNDNSKFTLMSRCYNWALNTDLDSITETVDGTEYISNGAEYLKYAFNNATTLNPKYMRLCPDFTSPIRYDPASNYYVKQVDNVEISVEKGFNSADSVASQITEDLQKYIETEEEGVFKVSNTANTGVFTTTTTSLLRPRHCASPAVMTKTNFGVMTSEISQDVLNFYNSYKHILVKRPDLFVAGRKCNNRFGEVPTVQLINGKTPSPLIELTDPGILQGTANINKNFVRNQILCANTGITNPNNNTVSPIITSWLWNDTNLEALRDLFVIQGNYEDLFKCEGVASDYVVDANAEWVNYFVDNLQIKEMPIKATIKNSRFLHMTRVDYDVDHNPYLGNDNYHRFTYGPDVDPPQFDCSHSTAPVFVSFNADKAYNYTNGDSINNLCYGFATRYYDTTNQQSYIEIHPELVNGIRADIFKNRNGVAGVHTNIEVGKCLIGWDYHFNSYGNTVMLAQTGMLNSTINAEWSIASGHNDTKYVNSGNTGRDLNPYYTQCYLGSNNTACVYDQISNKFGWEYLHIPENVGQAYNAGESVVIDPKVAGSTRLPLLDDAKNEVYKINKRLQTFTYCPDMTPYVNAIDGEIKTGSGSKTAGDDVFKASGPIEMSLFNINLEPWTVFDAHTGVCLNFGKCCDKLNWNKSLLGILGFTYEQFNPTVITQQNTGTQSRLTFNNIAQVYNPTTNSEVVSANIKDYVITPFGATQYYPMPSFMTSIRSFLTTVEIPFINYLPAITEVTQSLILEAQLLPKTVLNPYLNIRSDIIDESKYFGGKNSGLNYPICAVVNKINADKDFIQLDNSDIIFTCKRKMAITSITTVITDPDGTLALVDEGSSVIYKIQKNKNGKDLNIIGQVLEAEPKKK
tara:strand:+ start:53 stop:3289 length:3237 start_codon:yes stop_codon:yes gene_type:complete